MIRGLCGSKEKLSPFVGRTFVRDGRWLHRVDDNTGLWKLDWTRRIMRWVRKQMAGLGWGAGWRFGGFPEVKDDASMVLLSRQVPGIRGRS